MSDSGRVCTTHVRIRICVFGIGSKQNLFSHDLFFDTYICTWYLYMYFRHILTKTFFIPNKKKRIVLSNLIE